jgi:low temperature requirement protein LtrA
MVRPYARMTSRDPAESHRASTPLELLFDLTFVVAVAQAGSGLQHGLVSGRAGSVLIAYPLVFFAIWWAWMNFSWFASAYDTDDVHYRVAVLVQIAGVLIVAAGAPRAIAHRDFTVMVTGYVVMRLSMVGLWLRAAISNPEGRRGAVRYAAGIAVLQVGWVIWTVLARDGGYLWLFVLLGACELVVPVWAEAAGRTAWHPGHIAERFGLFTIIVLGESISAATIAIQTAVDAKTAFGDLATVAVGGLLTVFSLWWLYFDMPSEEIASAARESFAQHLRGAFKWGYGHYLIFAGAAATGSGLAVAVERIGHHSQLTRTETGLAFTVPVSLYLLAVWALHASYKRPSAFRNWSVPVAVVVLLLASLTSEPVLVAGLFLTALVAVSVIDRARAVRAT